MRIAFCLYGLSGGDSERLIAYKTNGGNTIDNMVMSYNSYKKYIFEENKEFDFDIYFHTYHHNNIQKIVDLYKPKKYIVDERIKLSNNDLKNLSQKWRQASIASKSRWNSSYKVLKLIDNNINYDYIMLLRFDITFLNEIHFNSLSLNNGDVILTYCTGRWLNGIHPGKNMKNKDKFVYEDKDKICDWFFIFKPVNINSFIELSNYGIDIDNAWEIVSGQPERFIPKFMEKNNLNIILKYKSFYDFILTRMLLYNKM